MVRYDISTFEGVGGNASTVKIGDPDLDGDKRPATDSGFDESRIVVATVDSDREADLGLDFSSLVRVFSTPREVL